MELSSRELRIGNWVKHKKNATSASEYPNTEFQWELAHFFDIERNHLHIDSIEPIPLTEEWIKKLGFKKPYEDESYKSRRWLPKETISHSRWSIYLIPEKGEWRINQYNKGKICSLKYVHQLQNLYFALTGTELIANKLANQKQNGSNNKFFKWFRGDNW